MKTAEAAIGKWHGILVALGVEQNCLVNKHGPCPMCGGRDRFRFDNKEGKGTWFCNGCGSGDGMSLALQYTGKEFKELASEIDKMLGVIPEIKPMTKKDPAMLLRKVYSGLRPAVGTLVEKYLNGRGVSLPQHDIAFHPSMAYFDAGRYVAQYPAMVTTFRNAQMEPITLHVTYLNAAGGKAEGITNRKVLPPKEPMRGGAIMLTEPAEVMGVAEGIETALAATELDCLPVWACANAGMLEQWEPPAEAKEIHIYADHDINYRGQAAAYKLAHKLAIKGISVFVAMPQLPGDWNDELLRKIQLEKEVAAA